MRVSTLEEVAGVRFGIQAPPPTIAEQCRVSQPTQFDDDLKLMFRTVPLVD